MSIGFREAGNLKDRCGSDLIQAFFERLTIVYLGGCADRWRQRPSGK
jgi:hypothetical protein